VAKGKHILITRPIDIREQDMFIHAGYTFDTVPLIATMAVDDDAMAQRIGAAAQEPHTVVFTSANAVQAVSEYTQGAVAGWDVHAIGHATLERIGQLMPGQSVVGTANDATSLAHHIIAEASVAPVIFFCGDQRREELPVLLADAGIPLEEVTVYHTIRMPVKIEPAHDGLVFFSPSAVISFFELNRPKEGAVFFAIGNTTAAEIRKNCENKVIIASAPSVAAVVTSVIDHYAKQEDPHEKVPR